MTAHLYSVRAFGPDQFAVTKFDRDLNPEATYSTNLAECDCPAGHRPTCRHRQMLQKFLQDRHIDDGWFLNWDTRQWAPPVAGDLGTAESPPEEPIISNGDGAVAAPPPSAGSGHDTPPSPAPVPEAKQATTLASGTASFRRRI